MIDNDNNTSIQPRSVKFKLSPKNLVPQTAGINARVVKQYLTPHRTPENKQHQAKTSTQHVRQEHLHLTCLQTKAESEATTEPNQSQAAKPVQETPIQEASIQETPTQEKTNQESAALKHSHIREKGHLEEDGQKLITLLLLIAACWLSYTGMLNHILSLVVHQPIENINSRYLNSALEDAEQTLVVLSTIKGALAVVQSSSGGISFFIDVNVQLGEILSVISTQIDNAWQVSMATMASIEAIKLLLNITKTSMTPLLTLLLIAVSLMYFLQPFAPNIAERMKRLSQVSLFLVILTHLIIPFSVLVNTNVSHHIFSSTKAEVHQGFSQIKQLMPAHNSNNEMHQQVKSSINQLKQHHQIGQSHASHFNHLTTKHKVNSYGEFVIVPIALIISFSLLTIIMIRRKSALDHQSSTE